MFLSYVLRVRPLILDAKQSQIISYQSGMIAFRLLVILNSVQSCRV